MKRQNPFTKYECIKCHVVICQYLKHLLEFHLTRQDLEKYDLDNSQSLKILMDEYYIESDKELTYDSKHYNKDRYIKDL